jgi:hypothetical protein
MFGASTSHSTVHVSAETSRIKTACSNAPHTRDHTCTSWSEQAPSAMMHASRIAHQLPALPTAAAAAAAAASASASRLLTASSMAESAAPPNSSASSHSSSSAEALHCQRDRLAHTEGRNSCASDATFGPSRQAHTAAAQLKPCRVGQTDAFVCRQEV